MPATRWNEQELNGNRLEVFEWEAYDIDENPVEFSATDAVRFKLAASEGGAALIDIDSGAADADGSIVIIDDLGDEEADPPEPASGRVRLAPGSTADLASGRYHGELLLVDDSETDPDDALKVIGRGTFKLRASIGGEAGLP